MSRGRGWISSEIASIGHGLSSCEWFFALSRNRTRHARGDRRRARVLHPSACHGASAWGCETTHRTFAHALHRS
jgi:hypothetical protein